MKKVFAVLIVLCFGMLANVTSVKADAEPEQVLYSNRCCDSAGNVRCLMGAMYPVGSGCFCYGQSNGWVC